MNAISSGKQIESGTKTGTRIRGRAKRVSIERILAFSGGPFRTDDWPARNLHTDVGVAEASGLPSVAASGPQYQSYLIEMLIDMFGFSWLEHGSMDVKFVQIVPAGSLVTPEVEVSERESFSDHVLFHLNVQCTDEQGRAVLVGTATGSIPLDG